MRNHLSRTQAKLGKVMIAILCFNLFLTGPPVDRVEAKDKIIIVNAEQPNVWTLEQAHYLLAQMHRRNLDLKAKSLEDLDPNEIAGLRFEVMRMLIEFGATFNQADLASNRLLSRQQGLNAERRQSLLTRRDRLTDESLTLTREIAELEKSKANAATQEEKDRLTAEIAAKTALRDKVDKQIESVDAQLEQVPAPSGDLKATEAEVEFDPDKLPKSTFDEAFQDAAKKQIEKFNNEPRMNASLRLENFLQMQYEIIAKQLTLLRDEVGPGERLLFLELPQTINASHHESNKKWAQSWWKIAGYTFREKENPTKKEDPTKKASSTVVASGETPAQQSPAGERQEAPKVDSPPASPQSEEVPTGMRNQRPITTSQDVKSLLNQSKPISLEWRDNKNNPVEEKYNVKFVNLDLPKDAKGEQDNIEMVEDELEKYLKASKAKLTNQLVRTIELIPRQGSLNVNDMKLDVRAGALSLVASFLFGFGSRLNVQRQREQFTQFVQQELYSSAFGKGSREFGWTFTPMPGTDKILPGVRTTYAVVVVPEEATQIVLETNGCYFPRSAYQPNDFEDTKDTKRWGSNKTSRGCGSPSRLFIVPIPSGNADGRNDFWVEGMSYQAVGKGKRIVVLVTGKNFSSQIGVLINGVPLIHSIGLAQPLYRDDSKAGAATKEEFSKEKISGRIERVDSNQIVFSFEMGENIDTTPTITLVAPGKAIDLNWLENISINGDRPATLLSDHLKPCPRKPAQPTPGCVYVAKPMFFGDPVRPLRIDGLEVFRTSDPRKVTVLITGAGFENTHTVFLNGVQVTSPFVSKTLLRAGDFNTPLDPFIQVVLSAGDKTIKSTAIANPLHLKIDKVTVISYEAATKKSPGLLVVRVQGTGFTEDLTASFGKSVGQIAVKSATEAILKIKNPDAAVVVTLTNPNTGASVKTVVTRKTAEEQ